MGYRGVRCSVWQTLVVLLFSTPALASDITECDRLAAEPGSVTDVPGVAFEAIDAEASIAACGAAVEADPSNPRLSYQYARALERAGRLNEARQFYGWAADYGHAAALAAIERLDAIIAVPSQDTGSGADTRRSERLAALSSTLRRYRNSLPADPGDPLTILAAVGPDPDALTAWIAENTRLVAYQGSLRGSRGVLLDRAGNSLDRALLLAALVRGTGSEVRLARAMLTEEQARALVPATERTVEVPRLPELSRDDLVAIFSDPRFDPETVRGMADEAVSDRQNALTLAARRFDSIHPLIREAVEEAAPEGGVPGAVDLAGLQDHFWVQTRVADGWRDLDPAAAALGALEPVETFDAAMPPPELRHRVEFRLVLELQEDARLREETLLSWGADAASLIGQPIVISHIPNTAAAIEQILDTTDFERRRLETLDQQTSWYPVLISGGEFRVDRRFNRDGQITAAPLNWLSDTGSAISALSSVFEGADEGRAAQPRAVPTAEWLEVEIRAPGAESVIERRTIFDLLGPAARGSGAIATPTVAELRDRALRLVSIAEILVIPATPSDVQFARDGSEALALVVDSVRTVLEADPPLGLGEVPRVPSIAMAQTEFALGRFRPGGSAEDHVVDGANVVLRVDRLSLATDQTFRRQMVLDIVRNPVTGRGDPFWARVEQGVADTVWEGVLMGDGHVLNAAALNASDIEAGRPWRRITASDLAALPVDGAAGDLRARMSADLDAGFIVIAASDLPSTAASGSAGWWRIDPKSGATLGMLPDGSGGVMAEDMYSIFLVVESGSCMYTIGTAVAGGLGVSGKVAGVLCSALTGWAIGSNVVGGVISADLNRIIREAK